jgi:hypothetical protein
VIAESFERIHRSNLVGMGVIPFEFTGGDTRKTLGLKGDETVSIHGLDTIQPLQEVPCTITYADGSVKEITLKCRIDTAVEIEYIEHGGVLHYVLRNLAQAPVAAECRMAEAEALARRDRRAGGVRDLSDPGATDRLIDDVLAREGRIDALVNNAAGLEQGPDGG